MQYDDPELTTDGLPVLSSPITIVARKPGESVKQALSQLTDYLTRASIAFQVDIFSLSQHNITHLPAVDFQAVTQGLVVCLGGDGSLLKLVDHLVAHDLPVLGVNLGNLGFLADLPMDSPRELTEILTGNFHDEHRHLLMASWVEKGETITLGPALNEVVINRANFNKTLSYQVLVDNHPVAEHHADGLIVATPTGSSAYALSAGGPILTPDLPVNLILPICPHKLTSRPLCLPHSQSIVAQLRTSTNRPAAICADGHLSRALPDDATITITTHEKKLRLIHPKHYNFFTTLKNKLHWEKTPHDYTADAS